MRARRVETEDHAERLRDLAIKLGSSVGLSHYELAEVMPIAKLILLHHERWDGQGYSWGITGKQITVECQVLAIVDAYDAITNIRPYRVALPPEHALSEIGCCAGSQFDPMVVNAFIEMMCAPDADRIVH